MGELRKAIAEWEARNIECKATYATVNEFICKELDAVGGFVTTTPDKNGFCYTFSRSVYHPGWTGGAAQSGTFRAIPFKVFSIPCHEQAGNRCHELETRWRDTATRVKAAQDYAEAIAQSLIDEQVGIDSLATAVLALVRDEKSDASR